MTKERLLAALGTVLLALGGWNLAATRANGEMVARMEERQIAAARVDEAVTRDIIELRARITAVEIQFGEFRRKAP